MLVCLACYEHRIASLLETASHLALYSLEGGQVVPRGDLPAPDGGAQAMAGLLFSLGVRVLVCGGLDGHWERAIREVGIMPKSWVGGDLDQILVALEQGHISTGSSRKSAVAKAGRAKKGLRP